MTMIIRTLKQVRRLIIAVVGFTVLALGIVLIVLPGPAILVIPAGLAILSIEFAWAKRLLEKVRQKIGRKRKGEPPESHSATGARRPQVVAEDSGTANSP